MHDVNDCSFIEMHRIEYIPCNFISWCTYFMFFFNPNDSVGA